MGRIVQSFTTPGFLAGLKTVLGLFAGRVRRTHCCQCDKPLAPNDAWFCEEHAGGRSW